MSGSNLSDSQNPSKSESLMSESSGCTTETDSIFYSSATETSTTSQPPSNIVSQDRAPRAEIPVVNLSDEDSPTQNVDGNPAEEETDLDAGLDIGQNVPKVYHHFTNEVVRFSSRHTSLSSITNFRRTTEITTVDLDNSILIEPCVENEKGVITAYTSSYKLWKQKFFRIRGVGASSDLLFGPDGTPHFPLFWSLEPHRVPKVNLNSLSEEDKASVQWLREQDLIDWSALLENEDNLAGLQTLLGNMPPKSQTTKTMDEVAMLKALRAREKKAKATEKVNIPSTEHLGTGTTQGEGETSFSQCKNKRLMTAAIQGP
ncbi:hypothetical protein SESBI_13181 [Sesbania bispinosa]|nr:hypothetical protein SESBI_13181 [Sesbania bispinosa]